MEDAATAEISRTQIWQWLRHGAEVQMEDGRTETMTSDLYDRILGEEVSALKAELGEAYQSERFEEAVNIFTQTATGDLLPEFLTIPAYEILEA